MKITKPDAVEKFKYFINNISKTDNVALMHDTDADGISAAVIVSKSLEKKGINISKFLIQDHGSKRTITDSFAKNLKDNNITKLICVDIALEDFIDIDKIEIPILVIDHHQSINRNKYSNITVYKPSFVQDKLADDEVCAANLAYKLFETIVDVTDLDWVVSIGIIGDYTFKQEKEFLEIVFKKYDYSLVDNMFDSTIGIAVQHITFANSMNNNDAIDKALQAILTAKNIPQTIENLKEFEVVGNAIEEVVNGFETNKEKIFDDLFIYIYKSPFRINSPVSSIISGLDSKVTYITLQEMGDVFKISARRQDKTKNMGTLLKKATKDLSDANGGGHIPAAGGQINKEDLTTFINNIKIIYPNLN